jgi:hAT family C-terminal dimerisation region
MLPRLLRAEEKLAKYAMKLDDSPYYLAARILDPECRTAFLKDKDKIRMTLEGEKKLYVVRKLWERFRNNASLLASHETIKNNKPTLEFTEQLSAFHKARRRHIEEQTRPQSQDEFDNYINENPIPLDSHTTSLQWWNLPLQRTRFPRLSQLAIEVLSIPGMSDKPERIFSGSRRRVPWDRTRTSPQILEETECLKDWADHGILGILL